MLKERINEENERWTIIKLKTVIRNAKNKNHKKVCAR